MVTIIGAGISGLSLAWHLQQLGKPYRLLEKSAIAGGYIGSDIEDGRVFEKGPNSLMVDDNTALFLQDIGLQDSMVEADTVNKIRFIYRDGKVRQLPTGPLSLLTNSYFSTAAKWRILTEPFRKPIPNPNPDETLADFIERRFNKEVVDFALDPFVMGIYGGNPSALLTRLAFPSLQQAEQTYGSVIKGLMKTGTGRKKVVNFKQGLGELVDTLSRQLKHFEPNKAVTKICFVEGKWQVHTNNEVILSDQVVITTTAQVAANLLEEEFPTLSGLLSQVDYPPMLATHSVYKKTQFKNPIQGFGALSPSAEKQFIAGSIWVSSIFPYKTNPDEILITSMVGGTRNREAMDLTDEVMQTKVHAALSRYFDISGEAVLQKTYRWKEAIPQYDAKLAAAWEHIPSTVEKNLYICANWYNGISVPDCIKKGRELAEKLPRIE